MHEQIKIGDTVRVKDVRSPRMVVIDQVASDDETVFTCLWFDNDQVPRQIGLKGWLLQTVEPSTSTFDTIPVVGYAR